MKKTSLLCLLLFLIPLRCFGAQIETTTITSDKASYDGTTIHLTGSVTLTNSLGTLVAGQATLKKEEEKTAPIDFPYLELKNSVQATLTDNSTLACDTLFIDCIALSSHFEADDGLVYNDARGTIIADEADVLYAKGDKRYEPIKVTLCGHVKIESDKNKTLSCALANIVEVFPQENRMILQGNPVLFYDAEQKMELSANKIEAKRDPKTGKERVQGFGKVRFSFAEQEIQKMKKQFNIIP